MAKTKLKKTARSTTRKASGQNPVGRASSQNLRSASKSKQLPRRGPELMGMSLRPWISDVVWHDGADSSGFESPSNKVGEKSLSEDRRGLVAAFGPGDAERVRRRLADHLEPWLVETALASTADSQFFQGDRGPIWLLRRLDAGRPGPLDKSAFARFRDLAGAVVPQLANWKLDRLILEFHDLTLEEEQAALVGMEMASYSYSENCGNPRKPRKSLPVLEIGRCSDEFGAETIESSAALAMSVNIARHLVNLPGGTLNPRTYAGAVQKLFKGSSSVKVEVWEGAKLERERMNLLLAVGGAAEESPRLVHLRYRPKKSRTARPIAIVGKGITFDTGGLDIKPSSGMRWMKKDMGGSASAVALAKWAEQIELPIALDFYLAIADNATGGRSLRPGDIVTARNGLTVEIHNTDAEGRLVLADALDVAVTQKGKDEPMALINVATLTGAIKIGLGAEIAGLFSNNDSLAEEIEDAGLARGDLSWRMPLYAPYRTMLRSSFADYVNAADGFAGAITAALFLELFVKGKPWAHLDVYAWRDSASGAWSEPGGNGQPVLALAELLSRFANGHIPAEFSKFEAEGRDED